MKGTSKPSERRTWALKVSAGESTDSLIRLFVKCLLQAFNKEITFGAKTLTLFMKYNNRTMNDYNHTEDIKEIMKWRYIMSATIILSACLKNQVFPLDVCRISSKCCNLSTISVDKLVNKSPFC